jgi:streptogramin lyase
MIASAQVEVEAAAKQIVVGDPDGQEVYIRNAGTDPVFLGNAEVTTGGGYELPVVVGAAPFRVALGPGEGLYGICKSGKKAAIHVLRTGSR